MKRGRLTSDDINNIETGRLGDLYEPKRSKVEYKQERRLAQLPLDRKCPVCGEVKLRSRQWVVGPAQKHRELIDGVLTFVAHAHYICCLTCSRAGHPGVYMLERDIKPIPLDIDTDD